MREVYRAVKNLPPFFHREFSHRIFLQFFPDDKFLQIFFESSPADDQNEIIFM